MVFPGVMRTVLKVLMLTNDNLKMLVKKRQDILKLIATDRQWLFLVSRIINLALGESIKILYSVSFSSKRVPVMILLARSRLI